MSLAGEDFKNAIGNAKDYAVSLVDANAPPAIEIAAQRFWIADATRTVAVNALQ